MKKIIGIVISITIFFALSACGSNSTPTQDSTKKEKATQTNVDKSKVEKDGLTLSATAKIGEVKGDRTKDNVSDSNGEYFADGSNIVKASDYKDIVVTVKANNKTNKTVDISESKWSAQLSDGYKFRTNIAGDIEMVQIQPNREGSTELHYIVKKDVTTKSIKLSFVNIKDEVKYKKMVSEAINGGTEQQLKEKYKDAYENYDLQADIK